MSAGCRDVPVRFSQLGGRGSRRDFISAVTVQAVPNEVPPRRVVAALLLTLVIGLWTGMVPTPGLTTAMTPVKVTVKSSAYTGKYR